VETNVDGIKCKKSHSFVRTTYIRGASVLFISWHSAVVLCTLIESERDITATAGGIKRLIKLRTN